MCFAKNAEQKVCRSSGFGYGALQIWERWALAGFAWYVQFNATWKETVFIMLPITGDLSIASNWAHSDFEYHLQYSHGLFTFAWGQNFGGRRHRQ